MNTFEIIYEVVKSISEGRGAAGFVFGGEGVQRQLFELERIKTDGRIDLAK